MAKGLYNLLTNSQDADAAGLTVDNDGQTLEERANELGSEVQKVIDVMAEKGVDVSGFRRTQLDVSALDAYDKVVLILEPTNVPDAVKNHPKTDVWDITDPRTKDFEGVRQTCNQIEARMKQYLL